MIRLISARKAPPTRGAVWRSLLALLLVVIASQSIGAPLWMGNDKEMLRLRPQAGRSQAAYRSRTSNNLPARATAASGRWMDRYWSTSIPPRKRRQA